MEFHHIGIFVDNIQKGKNYFKNILAIKKSSKIIYDKNLKVKILFIYDQNNVCYELVAGYGKNNPVDNTLNKKINLINHLAYKTNKFDDMIKKFKIEGNLQITKPKKAIAFNKRVVFFLTKLGFIIEIIEK
jgi:catechol 2,3-dioxygenase-like lactoylglutathione lyase family enzyme